jgi:hypothetical protein
MLQLRTLAGITACHVGSREPVVRELRAAESDEARMGEALRLFEDLPALVKRRILATHAAVTWPKGPPPVRREGFADVVTRRV